MTYNRLKTENVIRQLTREWISLEDSTLPERDYFSSFKSTKLLELDAGALHSIYLSGQLNEAQIVCMKAFLSASRIKTLNERNFKKIDEKLGTINENRNRDLIIEGWLGDMFGKAKEKAQEIGTTVGDALSGGWSEIKKIWSQFSEFIEKLCVGLYEQMKQYLKIVKDRAMGTYERVKNKALELAQAKVEEAGGKDKIASEAKKLGATNSHFFGGGFIDWWKDGLDNIKSGEMKSDISELKKIRNDLLRSKGVISSLLMMNESGDELHLSDVFGKYPKLKGIADFFIHAAGAIVSPMAKIAQLAIKKGTAFILKGCSQISKATRGPGVFSFVVVPLILGEITEMIVSNLGLEEALIAAVNPVLGGLAALKHAMHFTHKLHQVLMIIGIITVFANLMTQMVKTIDPDSFEHSAHHDRQENGDDLKKKFELAAAEYKKKFPNRNAPKFEDLSASEVNSFIEKIKSAQNLAKNENVNIKNRRKQNKQRFI